MIVKKTGTVLEFVCWSCDSVFVAGINSVKRTADANYYCKCPVCGAECHTDAAKQPSKKAVKSDE